MDATDVSDGLHSLRRRAGEIEDTLRAVCHIPTALRVLPMRNTLLYDVPWLDQGRDL